MDSRFLERLAAEVGFRCVGFRIRAVLPRPATGLALVLDPTGAPALDLAPLLFGGHLAATRIRLAAEPSAPLAVPLVAALQGRRLEGVRVLAGERVARLDLEGGGALILEILGGAGNIYVLDPAGVVRHRLREGGRPGGGLALGDAWRPPPPPAAGGRPGTGAADGAPPALWVAPAALPTRPGLAAPGPEASLDPLAPWPGSPLAARPDGPEPGDPVFQSTELLGDAVVRRALWLARRQEAAGRLAALCRRLARERQRLQRLAAALQAESRQAAAHGTLRRQAEAILAGLGSARRQGDRLQVPDPYDPQGPWLDLPLAPGALPQEEAGRLFRRAGRLERAAGQVAAKEVQAGERLRAVIALAGRAGTVTTSSGLAALEAALPSWLREARGKGARGKKEDAPRRSARRRRLERDPRYRKVRRFTLEGNWHVLVGGGATANDFLTFRLAAPYDFWLHAADYPGAHVVVRNPARHPDPPPEVLRRAAALAAHFSKAPAGGAVTVRWTQARHVRKGRGLPPGTVLLPRASTLRVRPAPPPTAGPLPA